MLWSRAVSVGVGVHPRLTSLLSYMGACTPAAPTGVALATDEITAPPGFLTPAAAMGDRLIERFARRNIEIKLD